MFIVCRWSVVKHTGGFSRYITHISLLLTFNMCFIYSFFVSLLVHW